MERDHLKDQGIDERIILKCILNQQHEKGCTGLMWLRMGTSGKLLQAKQRIFKFYKMQGISHLAGEPLAS
jgi:hypothetical protein